MSNNYLVVVEGNDQDRLGYSAYAPDALGVVATGETLDECLANMAEALQVHLAGLKDEGVPSTSACVPGFRGFQQLVAEVSHG